LALTNERKRVPNLDDPKKYEPLREYLVSLPPTTNETTLSFALVAQIIRDTLPPSATTYREWWSNQEGGSRAPHWRAAGFKVDHADLKRQIVRFKRIAPVKELPRALTLQEVISEVNERAQCRPFGALPEWRKAHKGMKSLPGTPEIAGTIFRKIQECGVFVADLTFVGTSSSSSALVTAA
jgi:hypothetical protein